MPPVPTTPPRSAPISTTNAHIARATLEGIAYQVNDLVKAMEADFGEEGKELRVDGGAANNNLLMQFQSDIFGATVTRPKTLETTALGAAYLAGLAVGYWSSFEELKNQWSIDKVFSPQMPKEEVNQLVKNWDKAVGRTLNWIEE